MSKPIVEFCILDAVEVSPDLTQVRVGITVTPSFRGFTSGFLVFEAASNSLESAVRERVAWRVKQETGLACSPDELVQIVVAPPVTEVDVVDQADDPAPDETAPDVADVPTKADAKAAGQRKRRGKR